MVDVAACLIVRDEEKTLPRLVASLRGVVDYWVVVDTGSEDRTVEVVREAFAGIPGELHERPFVDFGHNRTELLELARGKARWLLMLDADYVVEGGIDVVELGEADAYLVTHAGSLEYRTPRLVRGDAAWRYVGVVHEYLDSADGSPYRRAPYDGLRLVDLRDGGHRHRDRAATLARDVALLTAAVTRDPDDARSWFYLGRSLHDLGRFPEALDAFVRRISLGGWAEEVYYAGYQAGHCLARMQRVDEAIGMWLGSWEARPERLEALHAAVRELRILGRYRTALALADSVDCRSLPDDILFLHPEVWRVELPLERSICAYYVEGPEACLEQSSAILALPDLPAEAAGFARDNAELCRRQLASA